MYNFLLTILNIYVPLLFLYISFVLRESLGAWGFQVHDTLSSYLRVSWSLTSSSSLIVDEGYSNNLGSARSGTKPNL